MLAHIGGQHTANQNPLGPFPQLRIFDAADQVQFGILPKDPKEGRNMHILKHALVVVFLSQLRVELDLVEIVGALVVEVVRNRCQEAAEELEGADELPELFREGVALMEHLSGIHRTRNSERAWEKLW